MTKKIKKSNLLIFRKTLKDPVVHPLPSERAHSPPSDHFAL